jgi:hypothetical protein
VLESVLEWLESELEAVCLAVALFVSGWWSYLIHKIARRPRTEVEAVGEMLDTKEELKAAIDRLSAENEEDVPADKRAERIELLKAGEMLDTMYNLHMVQMSDDVAERGYETTGVRRDYGKEREDLVEFQDHLKERLNQYFAGR